MRAHALGESDIAHSKSKDSKTLHLYVCTHGARDCRCGNTGGAVYEALRIEVAKRGLTDQVLVGSVGHVGGHKYAANILVYPHGDWCVKPSFRSHQAEWTIPAAESLRLGTVHESDVPNVLDGVLRRHSELKEYHASLSPLCPKFWRGRMGLSKDEQLALHSPT